MILPNRYKPIHFETCDWKQELEPEQWGKLSRLGIRRNYTMGELDISTGDERIFMAGPVEAFAHRNYGCAIEDFLDLDCIGDDELKALGFTHFDICWDSLAEIFVYILYDERTNEFIPLNRENWSEIHNLYCELFE